jgi:hypothetical protein
MKKKVFTLVAVIILLLPCLLTVSCSDSKVIAEHQTPLKAAIIDQLGGLYPNEKLIQGVTQDLEKFGFTVTLIKGDDINVDLFKRLPSLGYKLIIFRVHAGTLTGGDKQLQNKTYLFTNELYSKSKYVIDQLAYRVVRAGIDENSPDYFAVSADFIGHVTQGQFNQSVIIMEGCNTLVYEDMAEAFISRGALIYTGWTASVKLDFVDDFTAVLVDNLCKKNTTLKEALYKTAEEKGRDPTYKSIFSYYPTENDGYSLSELK